MAVSWHEMADRDLRNATNKPAVRQKVMVLAESVLRHPPMQSAHEGPASVNKGLAYRRAVPLATRDNLVASDFHRDDAGFPFESYFYVFRPPYPKETTAMIMAYGWAADLVVVRFLRNSALAGLWSGGPEGPR